MGRKSLKISRLGDQKKVNFEGRRVRDKKELDVVGVCVWKGVGVGGLFETFL